MRLLGYHRMISKDASCFLCAAAYTRRRLFLDFRQGQPAIPHRSGAQERAGRRYSRLSTAAGMITRVSTIADKKGRCSAGHDMMIFLASSHRRAH